MSIQVLSDLHLEAPQSYDIFMITPTSPILALLGDIGNVAKHKDGLLKFLRDQLRQFSTVLFVPGNHEAYHSTWPGTLVILHQFESDVAQDNSLGEFVLLDRRAFKIPDTDTTVLGCSLFSHVPNESEMAVSIGLNDFYRTGDWDVPQHNAAHQRDLKWLNDEVERLKDTDTEIIILTHWSPTTDARSIDPKHPANSPIGTAFSTNLSDQACFKSEKVRTWVFGHTHFNCDFRMKRDGCSDLRLVTNQRGYYFAQASGFEMGKVLELS